MDLIVLNFHGLGDPHEAIPDDEKPYWLSHDAFGALLDRIWSDYDPKRFAFTFDDGNASDLGAAESLLAKGAKGSFFALAGRLGEDHYLSPADLRELSRMGMTVGLHGRDHVDWRRCEPEQWSSETTAARNELEDALGAPITEAAIPFGRYDRRVIGRLRRQGFDRIHTSDGGIAHAASSVWNRNTLRCDMSEAELVAILEGRWSARQRAKRALSSFVKRNLV